MSETSKAAPATPPDAAASDPKTETEHVVKPGETLGGIAQRAEVPRVLIIEDTVPVQKLLSRWMQKARCKVTCANNGSIGLNYLMTGCFDIVFVDFLMVRTFDVYCMCAICFVMLPEVVRFA